MPESDRAAFHLPGHPLPALINLKNTQGDSIDLFIASLSRPILVCAHNLGAEQDSPALRYLSSISASLAALRTQAPEIGVYGLSTSETRDRGFGFPQLTDTRAELTKALELPADGDPPVLRLCTMLLKEGQVTRIDYPVPPEEAGSRALELLQRDAGLL